MSTILLSQSSGVCFSRGEAEGPDGHRQGAPWHSPQGVQPHQPGAQPAGQEEQEGEGLVVLLVQLLCYLGSTWNGLKAHLLHVL